MHQLIRLRATIGKILEASNTLCTGWGPRGLLTGRGDAQTHQGGTQEVFSSSLPVLNTGKLLVSW